MDKAHLITPISLEFGDRCCNPADGWTDAELFGAPGGVPANVGQYVPFPVTLLEDSETRVLFGVCCRSSVTVNMDFTLDSGNPPTAEYRITVIDADGTAVAWTSVGAGITTSGNVPVTVDLNPNACGAIVQIDALAGPDADSFVEITVSA